MSIGNPQSVHDSSSENAEEPEDHDFQSLSIEITEPVDEIIILPDTSPKHIWELGAQGLIL